jgi:hypothetical protein
MPDRTGARTAVALAAIVAAALTAAAAPAAFDPARSDPRAIAIADLALQALGGAPAWEQTRYLHFAFAVRRGGEELEYRTHLWDRYTGRLRYENVDTEGRPIVVLLDVNTRDGSAWRERRPLAPEAAKALLDEAYEAWINDTYWLLMPYKMKDPGVRLRYAGSTEEGGAVHDRIELSFEGVGLTPKDRYWAYVNRKTHLMDRWAYVLQDDPPGKEPTVWEWKGWTRRGRVLLCPEKVSLRGEEAEVRILHPILEVYDAVPEAALLRPDPLPELPRPKTP